MKVLVTTPQPDDMGGVTNYYNVLMPYMPRGVEYFPVCRRHGESCFGTIGRLCCDYREFKNKLAQYDLIHINPSLGSKALIRDGLFLRAAKKKRKKVLVFVHGWDKACEAKLRERWLWLFKKYYFRADAFIVLANEFKDSLREMGYSGPIVVETTIVDDSVFQQAQEMSKESGGTCNVLFLSRVERTKGIYLALDAVRLLGERGHKVHLTVAGDGGELEAAKQYVMKSGVQDVEFMGYVYGEEKYRVLSSSDVYILPTYYGEGMPNSVLEAMGFGLPVITRAVGGLKDFFEDGKMGFIVESLEAEAFADVLEKLIEEPERCGNVGRHNREYARERFAASRVAKRIERIYEDTLRD